MESTLSNGDYDHAFKIVLIGDSGVGKSQILSKFTTNKLQDPPRPTVGVDYVRKIVKVRNKLICLNIWDLSGREMFKTISSMYYKDSVGVIYVYDITKVRSFENIPSWTKHLDETLQGLGQKDRPVAMLVGNKLDERKQRSITSKEAGIYAKEKGAFFIETSAADGSNVSKAFHRLVEHIYDTKDAARLRDDVDKGAGLQIGSRGLEMIDIGMAPKTVIQKQPNGISYARKVVTKCGDGAKIGCQKLFCC